MLKLIIYIRKYIGFDGLLHFTVSSILTCFLSLFLLWWIAGLIVLGVGIGKEVYDKISKKGCAEWKDLGCDLAGILIGIL